MAIKTTTAVSANRGYFDSGENVKSIKINTNKVNKSTSARPQ